MRKWCFLHCTHWPMWQCHCFVERSWFLVYACEHFELSTHCWRCSYCKWCVIYRISKRSICQVCTLQRCSLLKQWLTSSRSFNLHSFYKLQLFQYLLRYSGANTSKRKSKQTCNGMQLFSCLTLYCLCDMSFHDIGILFALNFWLVWVIITFRPNDFHFHSDLTKCCRNSWLKSLK